MGQQITNRHHRSAGVAHVLIDHLAMMLVASIDVPHQLRIR